MIVAFKERYQAEKFMFGRWTAPSAGEIQKTWVPNPPISVTPTATPTEKNGLGDDDQDMSMDTTPVPQAPGPGSMPPREMDYDVAEDDSWEA